MSDTTDESQEPAEVPEPTEAPRPRVAQTAAIQRASDGKKSIEFGDDSSDASVEITIQERSETSGAEDASGED